MDSKLGKEHGEEERLVQMVHDFIESDPPSSSPISSNTHSPTTNHLKLLQEILRVQSAAEDEVYDNVVKHLMMRSRMCSIEGKAISLKKWLVHRLNMDGYTASLCQTSWATTLGCPAGCYEYIDVKVKDGKGGADDSGKRLIVDTDFKSQFDLARPTPTYKEISEALPCIFVGEEHRLLKIISLLCSAAKESLKERGLHIPPWRTRAYMQCKWLSRDCHRVPNNNTDLNAAAKAKPAFVSAEFTKVIKPRRGLGGGGGSALSRQISNTSINCC